MTAAIRTIIVDDEPLARQGLAQYLEERDDIELVSSCPDGFAAMEAIEEHDPDLIFLDIQMPEMTGFDLIERVGADRMPTVVFVTAYNEHALAAFDAAAVDYVLKPVESKRIGEAVERAKRVIGAGGGDASSLDAIIHRLRDEGPAAPRGATRLKVRNGEHIRFVRVDDIEWFEADGNYIVLHQGEEENRIRSTLTGLQEALDPSRFVRVHRSVIINIDHLKEVQPWFSGDYLAIMQNGEQIRVSRRYKDDLLRDVF